MGEPKPVVQVAGRPLLQHTLDGLSRSRLAEIVVVLGYQAARVRREIALGAARVVVNRRYADGLSTSIRAGLNATSPSADAFLMVLGDQPFVAPETYDRLLDAWTPGGRGILIPSYRGRRGNPVLVDRSLRPDLKALSGDVGLRSMFGTRAEEILEIPVDDPGIRFDLDTPEQLRALENALQRGRTVRQVLGTLVENGAGKSP